MLQFLVRLVLSTVALLGIAGASQGAVRITDYNLGTALIVALALALANMFIKPILMFFAGSATFLLSCLTFGLWSMALSWLISGLIFYIAGRGPLEGFYVKDFVTALWASLVLSGINALVTVLMDKRDDNR